MRKNIIFPSGPIIVTSTSSKHCLCISSTTGEKLLSYPTHSGQIVDISVSPSRDVICSCADDGSVRVVALKTGGQYWEDSSGIKDKLRSPGPSKLNKGGGQNSKKFEIVTKLRSTGPSKLNKGGRQNSKKFGIVTKLLSTDDFLLTGDSLGVVVCRWLFDGEIFWEYRENGGGGVSALVRGVERDEGDGFEKKDGNYIDPSQQIFIGFRFGKITCLLISSGTPLFTHSSSSNVHPPLSPMASHPASNPTSPLATTPQSSKRQSQGVRCLTTVPNLKSILYGSSAVTLIDDSTGETTWSSPQGSFVTCLTITKVHAVSGSTDGFVTARDLKTGDVVWQSLAFGCVNAVKRCIYTPPMNEQKIPQQPVEMIISGSDDKTVLAWNGETGSKIWQSKESLFEVDVVAVVEDTRDGNWGFRKPPAILYADATQGTVISISPADGSPIWSTKKNRTITTLNGSARGIIGICYDNGSLECFDIRRKKKLWENSQHHRTIQNLEISDNFIFTASSFSVRCFKIESEGEVVWEKVFEDMVASLLCVHNKLIVGTEEGKIHSIDFEGNDEVMMDFSVDKDSQRRENDNNKISVTELSFDKVENCILAVVDRQTDRQNADCKLLKLTIAGKIRWEALLDGKVVSLDLEDEGVMHKTQYAVLTKSCSLFLLDVESGAINKKVDLISLLNGGLKGSQRTNSKGMARHVAIVEELVSVTLDHSLCLFSLDSAKLLWMSKKYDINFNKCTKTKGGTIVLSSLEKLYVLSVDSGAPLLNEIQPSHHTTEITAIMMSRDVLLSASNHVSYHKIKYANKYGGLSVGMKVEEAKNDLTLMDELGDESEEDEGKEKEKNLSYVSFKARLSRKAAIITEKQNYVELRLMQLSMLVIFAQRCSFAFKIIQIPTWYEDLQARLEEASDFFVVLDSFFDWKFQYTILVAFWAIITFVISFAIQESIEMKKFIHPKSKLYNGMWGFLSGTCALFSGVLVIPITGILMKIFKCEEHDIDPSNKTGLFLSASLERGEDLKCWEDSHLYYAIFGGTSLIGYIPIALRFIRVDKKLENLEVKRNFFDWKGDIIGQEDRKHEMSLKDTKAERASFVVGSLLAMCGTFIEDEFVNGVFDFVVQSVFVLTILIYPSYFDAKTNKLSLLLAWLTLYLYGTALISEITDDNSTVEMNMSLLGVPTIFIVGILYLQKNWFRSVARKFVKNDFFLPKWRRKKIYVEEKDEDEIREAIRIKFADKWRRGGKGDGKNLSSIFDQISKGNKPLLAETNTDTDHEEVDDDSGYVKTKHDKEDKIEEEKVVFVNTRLVLKLCFVANLLSMGQIIIGGICYLYNGENVLLRAYPGAWYVGFIGTVSFTFCLLYQEETKILLLAVAALFSSMLGSGSEYNAMALVRKNRGCLDIKSLWWKNVAGGMVEFGYQDGLSWSVQDDVWKQRVDLFLNSCPIVIHGGTDLTNCDCCSSLDGDLNNRVVNVLYHEENVDEIMDDCLCFSAVNLNCQELTSGFFENLNVASFYLSLSVFFLSFVILLMTTKEFFRSIEEKTKILREEAVKKEKATKIKKMKQKTEQASRGKGLTSRLKKILKRDAAIKPK